MISYLLPTRDRHERLQLTLEAIGALSSEDHRAVGGAEVIVVDNASSPPKQTPKRLPNGIAVRLIRLEENRGAAARNVGVEQAAGDWIIMLDDDSWPMDTGHIPAIQAAAKDVAAINADIVLSDGSREAGGLPEVFIGCGVALRAEAFRACGGYDAAFDYYAEEYDLAAKLILAGWRIVHDHRFRVRHAKITTNRDMNVILHRLVRNNAWVAQRYAPESDRVGEVEQTIERYGRISVEELAASGFARGMGELLETMGTQPRREMTRAQFDRFTGVAHARRTLAARRTELNGSAVALVDCGKNEWAVRQALEEMNASIVGDPREAACLLIGTLSPGPMLDARDRHAAEGHEAICAWLPEHA